MLDSSEPNLLDRQLRAEPQVLRLGLYFSARNGHFNRLFFWRELSLDLLRLGLSPTSLSIRDLARDRLRILRVNSDGCH
jgi:hypothetical protein